MSIELACLYYAVRSRFYEIPLETYCDAMNEIGNMAHSCKLNMNDLAKICA